MLEDRERQTGPGGLISFVRYFWSVLEPVTPLVEGRALEAVCAHLEAVTFGDINRLLMNVPPGFMKSLLTDVFWPAWEWGPQNLPHLRYVAFSYAASLTWRDNAKFRDLIISPEYQELWRDRFRPRKIGEERVSNDKTGWKLATSVQGVGTGERGDRVILDDPHNVKESESEKVRAETVRWFREGMSNRLNDMNESAIVVIMQRVHEADVSGVILAEDMGYTHLMIPMEFEEGRRCRTSIGWTDWRDQEGELAWPERFPPDVTRSLQRAVGPYAYAGQYQQSPTPRGGGIIKSDWWQLWPADEYPPCSVVVAWLDTAYTEKQENDSSAITIWGLFSDEQGHPKVVLLYGWEGRLEIHDLVTVIGTICSTDKRKGGDLEKVLALINCGAVPAAAVPRLPVDRLVIEAKASGISVGQELKRLYGQTGQFGVELVDPSKWGDKVARMYAVQHLFSDEMVYAPERGFAELVINNVSSFPKAAHDDLADTVSGALGYMRRTGLLLQRAEYTRQTVEEMTFRPRERPLY